MIKYVVSHLEEQIGPLDEAELKAKYAKGDLLPIDYVYDDQKKDWVLLSEKFIWAQVRPEVAAPPPIKEPVKKKRPPEPPQAIEISGNNVMKEWKKAVGQGAKVKLIDGVGEIDLSPLQPGDVELILQDSSAGMLKLHNPLKIHVKPAEPFAVEWSVPAQQTVGQDAEIAVKAMDRAGHACTHYDDRFLIRVQNSVGHEIHVDLKDGVALVKIPHTKSESWKLSFHYSGSRVLKLPEDKTMEWLSGPATRLILDGPSEYIAGHPLKIHVKAVDHYGNLAKTFQGTVILEVKAS